MVVTTHRVSLQVWQALTILEKCLHSWSSPLKGIWVLTRIGLKASLLSTPAMSYTIWLTLKSFCRPWILQWTLLRALSLDILEARSCIQELQNKQSRSKFRQKVLMFCLLKLSMRRQREWLFRLMRDWANALMKKLIFKLHQKFKKLS